MATQELQGHRQSDRVKTFLRAQIIYNNRMVTVDCVVKNISSTGAKLAVDEMQSVPEVFDLYIPQKKRTYSARMIWRDAHAIGITFINSDAQQPTQPEAMSESAIQLRLRSLELQNAELRTRVQELSKRLEDLGQDPDIAACF